MGKWQWCNNVVDRLTNWFVGWWEGPCTFVNMRFSSCCFRAPEFLGRPNNGKADSWLSEVQSVRNESKGTIMPYFNYSILLSTRRSRCKLGMYKWCTQVKNVIYGKVRQSRRIRSKNRFESCMHYSVNYRKQAVIRRPMLWILNVQLFPFLARHGAVTVKYRGNWPNTHSPPFETKKLPQSLKSRSLKTTTACSDHRRLLVTFLWTVQQ